MYCHLPFRSITAIQKWASFNFVIYSIMHNVIPANLLKSAFKIIVSSNIKEEHKTLSNTNK